MNLDDLYDSIESINSKEDFDNFLTKLHNSFLEHADEWENNNLDSYLNGMISFSHGIKGYYLNVKNVQLDVSKPTWRLIAELLMGAIVHE